MKRLFAITYRIILLCFCFLTLSSSSCAQRSVNFLQSPTLQQNMSPPPIPAVVTFCGELVPMECFDVRESLRREMNSLSYWHSSMIYTMQLSGRYLEIIENLLKECEAPDDLKYLCIAESNLQNLVSPSKAAGFWQFLAGTARDFGLHVTSEVDERYNLEKATRAACQYLKNARDKFGSWTMAAAAYNVGMGHIAGQIATQKQNSYYDLHLNVETARYVYRAVAYKIIMQNPETYGFYVPKNDFQPLKYIEMEVTGPVNWISFAETHNTNYKLLRMFNPWIIDTKLSSSKTYTVKIPTTRN